MILLIYSVAVLTQIVFYLISVQLPFFLKGPTYGLAGAAMLGLAAIAGGVVLRWRQGVLRWR